MSHDRLDYFIKQLMHRLTERSEYTTFRAVEHAWNDLVKEDERQVKIEEQAYNDVHDHLKYGSGE